MPTVSADVIVAHQRRLPVGHAATYQYGPSGFVIAVTGASRFGLLHFVTLDPASQLMGQSGNKVVSATVSTFHADGKM